MEKKIICIIPARGGSKGVPKKNIKLLKGKPLIQYTYEFAAGLGIFDTICLSTDSDEIVFVAKSLGMDVPFMRPVSISGDESPTFDLVKHAIDYFKETCNKEFDYVCLLQPTVPFRDANLLLPSILGFVSQSEKDTLISFREVPNKYNPKWLFKMDVESKILTALDQSGVVSRRQDLPKFYYRDGSIYVFKVANLLSNSIYGRFISPIILNDENDINIDTTDDWMKAEEFANKYL